MSKTLTVKKPVTREEYQKVSQSIREEVLALDEEEEAVEAAKTIVVYSREELLAMLQQLGPDPDQADSTMDLPTGVIPAHLIADKSQLPPVGERTSGPVQPPAKIHGSFSLNGIPVLASPLGPLPANIDPATGQILAQIMPPRQGGCISPPPSRNFK